MIAELCEILNVNEQDILGRSRSNEISIIRHIYFWLMYQSGYNYSEIGRLNGRNHATIMNSVQAINNALEVNDRKVLDILDRVKHLKASKTDNAEVTEPHLFICPNCNGRSKVVVFEDYFGYEPPEMSDCELCEGTGKIKARKILRFNGNTIVIIK